MQQPKVTEPLHGETGPGDYPHFLTVEEAARLLKASRNTLYEAIKQGALPGVIHVGRRITINLQLLIDGCTRPSVCDAEDW